VDYDWISSRFASKALMEGPGIPSTRWFDATLLPKQQISQPDTLKAMVVMGHGVNTITRMPEAVRGIEKARSPGRLRSLPDGVVRRLGAQEWHLSAPRLHEL